MSLRTCVLARKYLISRQARLVCAGTLAGLLLSACGASVDPLPAESWTRCVSVSGQHPAELLLPPLKHAVLMDLREHGISVRASLDGGAWSTSPVARLGTIVLLPGARAKDGGRHHLSIRAEDSQEISGSVCANARMAPPASSPAEAALQAFAQAGIESARRAWPEAYRTFVRAARAADAAGDRPHASAARLAMTSIAYWHLEEKRLAEVLASAALSLDRDRLNRNSRSQLIELLAMARMDAPDGDARERLRALSPLLDRAEALAQGLFARREAPRLENLRGFLYYNADDLTHATALFEHAAQRCEALRDWECYARARQNHVLSEEGAIDYPTALQEYRGALEHLDPALEPHLAADISENLGGLQGLLALTRDSQLSYLAAIRLYASSSDCDGVRRSLSRLGSMLVDAGTLGDASALLNAAAMRNCAELTRMAANTGSAAQLSDALGGQDALSPAAQTCSSAQPLNHLSPEGRYAVFVALLYLGTGASQSGAEEQANGCFRAARNYITDTHARLRYDEHLAEHRARYGATVAAAALYQDMLASSDEAKLPPLHVKRGVAELGLVRTELAQGRTRNALARLTEVVGAIGQRGDTTQLLQALRLHAAAMRAVKNEAAAEDSLRGAAGLAEAVPIAALDGDARAAFLATQHNVFTEWIDLAATQAMADPTRTWQALATSERGRARTLRLARQEPDGSRVAADTETGAYQRLVDALREAAGQPGFRASWPALLLDRIRAQTPVTESNDRDGLRTQRALAPLDVSLVEFAAGDERLFAFVANGADIRLFALGPLSPIRTDTARLLDALRNPEATTRSVEPAARALARRVWWPILGAIKRQKIVIVADDVLNTVPFAALPWSAESTAPTLARAQLSFLPSASLLVEAPPHAAPARQKPAFVLFGDPINDPKIWSRQCGGSARLAGAPTAAALPGSRAEVIDAAAIMRRAEPGAIVDVNLGCAATREELEHAIAAEPLLLHIATHGSIDASRPRLSALSLSGTEDADFSVADILRRHFSARLVVLSACETSAGRLLPGEGVLGPAQAFLQAGARTVVGSGWRVPDAGAAQLMARFYALLFDHGLSASQALRTAQLEALSRTHSYAWAAFSLYGSPDIRFSRVSD